MPKFYVIDGSKELVEHNAHWADCQRRNVPFVHIRLGKRFAKVEIDMFSTDRDLDEATASLIRATLIKNSHAEANVTFPPALLVCGSDGVIKDQAKAVATEIFKIANEAMLHLPRLDESRIDAAPASA